MKLILKTVKMNNRTMVMQTVAETHITFATESMAHSYLKRYVYTATETQGLFTKKLVTQSGIYTLNAELRTS